MPQWPPFPQSHRLETISPLRPSPVFHRRRLHHPSRPLPSQPHMFPMRSPLVLVLHLTDVKGVRSSCPLFDVSHSNCRHSRRRSTAWSLPQVQRKCQLHPPLPPQLELLPGARSSFPPPPPPSPCSFLLPLWGGLPTDNGTVNPSSVVHSFGLGQFNCRRLWVARWGCAQRVHGPRQLFEPAQSPSSLCPRNRVSFDGNSSHRPAFPLRRPCWKLWPRGGFSVPFLNPFVSYSRDCGSPVSPLASGLRCHLRLLVLRATCWHLCRCPCGVLTHIGRFCASCLTHPSRFTDVACWGLQCVASPFPACLVATS